MDLRSIFRRRYHILAVLAVLIILYIYLSSWTSPAQDRNARFPGISSEFHHVFASHAINNTVIIVPVNTGMIYWVENMLCSLAETSFDVSRIVFWALDLPAQSKLVSKGRTAYHDPTLFATSDNENRHGDTAAYKRMMNERPKFYIDVLSSGFDMLMLDADTVFWQSPELIIPGLGREDIDIVYSTDAREFYQVHNAFEDERRRGPYVPPICNGIFWMRSSNRTIALWSEILSTFQSPLFGTFLGRQGFQDDQRGMDVLLNDGRAQISEPYPDGITSDMIPESGRVQPYLNVQLLDQTMVANGQLLMNRRDSYVEYLDKLKQQGKNRISAHFNWNTKEVSKEDGAKQLGMIFANEEGTCLARPSE
ncbi:hypothetical protein AC578_976 [Pseudocercospora eumusae]|uniref:Nucleotide-diphospho-sugar transferase domain-containing protein n=1 Tax=Pseudocercospora eumusae TaxID=321146 RepID=A0A139HEJ6_9PEZI|nr:hypothetical protein AC578_976 [Pseudocercospora eumusae]